MSRAKEQLGLALRRIGLGPILDRALLTFEVLRHARANRDFLAAHPDFTPPPAELAYDAYHHVNWPLYFDTGIAHARYFGALIRKHADVPSLRFCEWGCGPARILRHLRDHLPGCGKVELYGTDYNPETIDWCRQHLHGIFFMRNELEPPLPFEDNFFDAMLVRSVFTHLSAAMHDAWIAELLRVLKPGGLLIVTTHGNHFRSMLTTDEAAAYDRGDLATRAAGREGRKTFTAFHPPAYVRGHLLSRFDVVEHLPGGVGRDMLQDTWIARKRS